MSGVECRKGGFSHTFWFALEAFSDQAFKATGIQIEHAGYKAQRENIFPLVFGGASNGFDGQLGNRTSNVAEFLLILRVGFHMRGIV